MQKIEINKIISSYNSVLLERSPRFVKTILLALLSRILHIREINNFVEANKNLTGAAFIGEVFETLDVSFSVADRDRIKIPSEGKVLIISNHPLGGLDGLMLLKLFSEVRSDIKIIVNDVLLNIDNIKEFFLPLNIFSGKSQRDRIENIYKSINNDEAVIIFPAGEVARLGFSGISDSDWKKSVLQMAVKFNAPVLPVYIHAKNSLFFYVVSLFSNKLSMFLLVKELFNKRGKTFSIKIGHHIPAAAFDNKYRKAGHQIKLLYRHTLLIGKGKKGIYATEKNVIHPLSGKLIRRQLQNCKELGLTSDKKKIFLVDSYAAPDVIKEIARLREITFRKVSEGTGKKMDIDKYDEYYKHIVLWDDNELEIVGAYRIGIGRTIMPTLGLKGFYTSELFDHSHQLEKILQHSAELGRSFIQSKYWNTSALDYLWQGLGVFLHNNPEIKYTFGGVSLSKTYSDEAKKNIVYFYKKWFGSKESLSSAKNKYMLSANDVLELQKIYSSTDYKTEILVLKNILKHLGYTIPTLYKQYSELCEPDGIKFLDFCIDPDFNNCVDSLILVEVDKIKPAKKERYINQKSERKLFVNDLIPQNA